MIGRGFALVPLVLLASLVACGGDDATITTIDGLPTEDTALCLDVDRAERPVVDLIAPALDLAAELFDDPEFYEVSADRQRVSMIVAMPDGEAQQTFFCSAGYVLPTSLGPAGGSTFTAEAVELDAATIFDGIDAELDAADVVDVALVGDGAGGVIYDARVRSAAGGTILVRLTPTGTIVGVQAE